MKGGSDVGRMRTDEVLMPVMAEVGEKSYCDTVL
ncbi:hypothetical protein L195_g064266, partial [Trifolium pratense]